LLSKYSDPREQGVVFGLYHGLMSLARVAGPIVAGVAYAMHPRLRNTGQFWVAGILLALLAVWTAGVRRRARGYPVNDGRHGEESKTEGVAQAARAEVE
jgi:MFS family permease